MEPCPELLDFPAVLLGCPPRFADGKERVTEFVDNVLRGLAPLRGAYFPHPAGLVEPLLNAIYGFLHAVDKGSPSFHNLALHIGLK